MEVLCGFLGVRFDVLNVHGGITEDDVVDFVGKSTSEPTWIFFDEINTTNCMGLFKEILCDRTLQGIPIPENITVVAACNPYMLRLKLPPSKLIREERAKRNARGLPSNTWSNRILICRTP